MLSDSLRYCRCQWLGFRERLGITLRDLPGRVCDANSRWSQHIHVEHRANRRQHCSQSQYNDNLFSDGNQRQRLFCNSQCNRHGQRETGRRSHRHAGDNLPRWIIYTYGRWCQLLRLEHGPDRGQHHGQPGSYNHLLRHRDNQWLFDHGDCHRDCRRGHFGECLGVGIRDLPG